MLVPLPVHREGRARLGFIPLVPQICLSQPPPSEDGVDSNYGPDIYRVPNHTLVRFTAD